MNAIVKGIFLLLALSAVFCVDLDGDGFDTDPAFGRYQDCCDSVLDGCFDPYMVNPGAFEIPNNGILDRCTYDCTPAPGKLQCENLDLESLPCDSNHLLQESYILSGPQITSSDTEPAIWAMDLCEFKDDDDDPSWGFYRQTNAIFALADQRRNGFDIGVIGPDVNQASVLRSFGRIGPVNGDYMLALSSGYAKAQYQPTPNNVGALSYDAVSQPANLPNVWTTNDGDATNFNCGEQSTKPSSVEDSILLRFNVVQPSNMNAFSFKVLYMDAEITPGTFTSNTACNPTQSWFLALKNGTHTPSDHNIAGDKHNFALYSFNPNIDFITQCDDWRGNWPANTCPDSEIRLEGTGYDYASNWIPVGSAADPKEVFELLFITFDNVNPNLDATVLIDDFKVMGEAREPHSNTDYLSTYWGYQYTGDLALVSLIPDVKGLYPAGTKTVSLNFVIRNEGPEIAGDVTIAFTPPFGTKFNSISSATTTFAAPTVFPATGGFEDNSYHKIKTQNNLPLLPHETISGKITFDILTKAPKDIQFRVTVSTSSIDYVWGNNHLLQIVYIDKPLNGINA